MEKTSLRDKIMSYIVIKQYIITIIIGMVHFYSYYHFHMDYVVQNWQNVTFLFNKFAIWAYLLIIIDFRQIILMDFIRYCYDYKIKLILP
jgi:hypothetical protein